MASPVRIGIIGCGSIAERRHVPGLIEAKAFEITALCDIVPERMAAVAAHGLAAERFADSADLIRSGAVDAVAICTPNDLHAPMALDALGNGLHVLCEKPMGGTLDQATAMIRAAETAGRVLHINQTLHYLAPYRTVAKLVAEGGIGEPFHARCIRAASGTPDLVRGPGADWFLRRNRDGGVLLDLGIHIADWLRMILGPAQSAAGLQTVRTPGADAPDNVSALFRFRNGAVGVMELSWTVPGGAGMLEVYGSRGRVRMDLADGSLEWMRQADGVEEISRPEAIAGVPTSWQAFRDAVRGMAPSPTPGAYGRRALAMCLAVQESFATGGFRPVHQFEGDDRLP